MVEGPQFYVLGTNSECSNVPWSWRQIVLRSYRSPGEGVLHIQLGKRLSLWTLDIAALVGTFGTNCFPLIPVTGGVMNIHWKRGWDMTWGGVRSWGGEELFGCIFSAAVPCFYKRSKSPVSIDGQSYHTVTNHYNEGVLSTQFILDLNQFTSKLCLLWSLMILLLPWWLLTGAGWQSTRWMVALKSGWTFISANID